MTTATTEQEICPFVLEGPAATITLSRSVAKNAGARSDEAHLGAPIAPNPRKALELHSRLPALI